MITIDGQVIPDDGETEQEFIHAMFTFYQEKIAESLQYFFDYPNIADGFTSNQIDYVLYWIERQHWLFDVWGYTKEVKL